MNYLTDAEPLYQAYEPIYRASLAMAQAAHNSTGDRPTNRRKRSESDDEEERDENMQM